MPVYIARIGDTDTVKIGFSYKPALRVKQLRWAHGVPFTLARVLDGDLATERWFHTRFAAVRAGSAREVFRFDPAMLSVEPPCDLPANPLRTAHWVTAMTKAERARGEAA